MNNLLPEAEQDSRSKKINLRFKLCVIAYMLILGGTLFFLMQASDLTNSLCAAQSAVFGSCYLQLNAVILVIGLLTPVLIAQAIVWKVTGVRIEYPKGRSSL